MSDLQDTGTSPENPHAPDYEPTSDSDFGGEADGQLGTATKEQTGSVAAEEDGSAPDEPQPTEYPPEDV